MGLFQCDANFLFWFHIHKLSKQTNKREWLNQMRSDLSNRSSNYICTLLITHRFTNNTIFFLCHSSFELYFYALEFLLIFFLHLILFLHSLSHTHIVHICNYFPSIDVNKNHSIKQNKKKILFASQMFIVFGRMLSLVFGYC